MAFVTIKELLECGVHFGHQTRRWNPKMARYIFGDRNGIYIINLEKTMLCLEDACNFLNGVAKAGKNILFVGTKKQAQDIIGECAKKCGMPYVINRWLGGMLTNFETVHKSILRMKNITKMEKEGSYERLTKKEVLGLIKERDKMKKNLEGIEDMTRLPGAVFIIDPKKETIALREARKLNIPVIAFLDTNCDPDEVDYPIPGNDDALRSIAIICNTVTNSIIEGINEREKVKPKKAKAQPQSTSEDKEEGAKKKPSIKKEKSKAKAARKTAAETKTEENNVSVT